MPELIWIENVLFPLLGMGLGGTFAFWIYKTVNHWIDRKHEREMARRPGNAHGPELERLRGRVEVLEQTAERLQELEERLDFMERVLARERERPALGDGHQRRVFDDGP